MQISLTALACIAFVAPTPQKAPIHADPAAVRVLDTMVKTYRAISKLHQETIYSAGEGKVPPLIRTRLVMQRPNRIVLDMVQPAVDREKPYRLLYQSDGRDMYAYQETKGFYAKEKAPKTLKELDYLAISIEMAAITGANPIPDFIARSKSVRLAEPHLVDSVMADVVVFEMGTPERTVEVRLSIGQQDHLLRRFAYSSNPNPKPPAELPKDSVIVGDPNDPNNLPPPSRTEEPIRFSYDNLVIRDRNLPKDVFKWVAPAGSFAYQDYPSVLNPTGGTGAVANPTGGVLPNNQKPAKIIRFEDLMKEAWKKNKRR